MLYKIAAQKLELTACYVMRRSEIYTSAVSSVRLESVSVETPTVDIDAGVNAVVMTRIVCFTATAHHYTSQATPVIQ